MIKEHLLADDVAAMLNISLDGRASVTGGDGHVLIAISQKDFEQHLGDIFRPSLNYY